MMYYRWIPAKSGFRIGSLNKYSADVCIELLVRDFTFALAHTGMQPCNRKTFLGCTLN